jgi:hypothetical protein
VAANSLDDGGDAASTTLNPTSAPFCQRRRSYVFCECGVPKNASFHGLFYDRSEKAVRDRLREAHRFAERVEIVEMRWLERPAHRSP